MEGQIVSSICPVCQHGITVPLSAHLQSHSKQDLIYALINQHDASIDFPKNIPSPDRTGRPSSPSKKSRGRSSPRNQPFEKLQSRSVPVTCSSTSVSCSSAPERIMLELDLGEFEDEPESTEILPAPLGSYVDQDESDPNAQFQIMFPIGDTPVPTSSHTNFIQYIIETPTSGTTVSPHLAEWVLPDGRTIPVFSRLTPITSEVSILEDPLSLDTTPSSFPTSTMTPSEFDLMTDEEIPPRGEISEYEESNTSSPECDELNKPNAIHIGPTLGSLFSNLRRLPPLVESEENSNNKRAKTSSLISNDRKVIATSRIQVTSLKSLVPSTSSSARIAAENIANRKSTAGAVPLLADSLAEERHKCPENNCSQVGSIFELAKHQELVHQLQYYKSIKKEADPDTEQKPLLTKSGKVKKPQQSRSSSFSCAHCPYYASNLVTLHQHLIQDHPEKPSKPQEFECGTCGKLFQKRVNLNKHVLIHDVKKFPCECGKAFTSRFKLMEHERVHTKNYPFRCLNCDRPYRTPSLLKAHMARAHPIPGVTVPIVAKKLEFFCAICTRVLRSKRTYLKHLQLHNETTQKCYICHETFSKAASLTRHIRNVHDASYETKESKGCPICFKKMHPNSMKSHMRIHDDVKPFPCIICPKRFRTAANLTSHSWSHTNAEKPFKCTLCPKSYLFKKCLEVHLIVHKTRRFHFSCNECGMKFTSKVNLKRHCQEHYTEKKYKCPQCPKKFHRKYYLVEHERVHSGTKPFNCTICGKLSTTRSNHRAHVKIHDARDSATQEG